MTAISINAKKIDLIIKEWEDQIKSQRIRADKRKMPSDIAMVAKNIREYPNGVKQTESAFPIYYGDKLGDVIRKYSNCFPEEAKFFVDQIKLEKSMLLNEKGMSMGKTQRLGAQIPEKLYAIIKWYGKHVAKYDFLSAEGLRKLKEELPICFIGSLRNG